MRKDTKMNAGLPTTGIGGIFYTLSVFFMVMSETFKLICGKSSLDSWKIVFNQVLLVSLMIGSIFYTGELLGYIFPKELAASLLAVSDEFTTIENTNSLFLVPIVLLIFLLSTTQILRLYFYLKSKKISV